MAITVSPLRYPGGKSSLYPFVKTLIDKNRLQNCTYIEPYAGGAGLALKLLFNGDVGQIVLNDCDPAIFSFWNSVLNRTDDLICLIKQTPVTIQEWYNQKDEFDREGDGDLLYYGFATFFLNRTNVSGILKGGVIGGVSQTGSYKINARFKKDDLISKICKIASHKSQITLFNLDALDLIYSIIPEFDHTFINYDPPYVSKGSKLYTNFYQENDHKILHNAIIQSPTPWMVTYDDCDLIRHLYADQHAYLLPINYSAGSTKSTKEIGIFSKSLIIPEGIQKV